MRKWLIPLSLVFSLVISLLLPNLTGAQDPITLSSLEVQIWPEYDQPGVLVIYMITVSASSTNPATLSVRIPIAAGEPNAVAARSVDGTLYTIDKTRQVSGDWATITFTTPSSEVQLEYYDPSLQKDGAAHHYQYIWPGDYATSQFTIQVQQPVGATDMHISPSLGSGVKGSDGLTYYTQDIGSIPAGQNIDITIDYQKSSDALSVENLPVQPSAPIPQSTSPDLNVSAWLPWVLGILGAGLIIGGIVWFWQSGRQRATPQARRERSRRGFVKSEAGADASEVDVYCSQCGKRATPGDKFCRYCGTPIRSK